MTDEESLFLWQSLDPGDPGQLNGTRNTSGPFWEAHYATREFDVSVVMPVLYGLICALGLVGNGIVLYVMARHSKLRSPADIFIFNLALADVLFMLGMPFQIHQFASEEWAYGAVMCKIVMALDSHGVCLFIYLFVCLFRSTSLRLRSGRMERSCVRSSWPWIHTVFVCLFIYLFVCLDPPVCV
ncbi:somatostatin receptor type 5-like [Branchiostoma floridae x Branchiostoma belcheri]